MIESAEWPACRSVRSCPRSFSSRRARVAIAGGHQSLYEHRGKLGAQEALTTIKSYTGNVLTIVAALKNLQSVVPQSIASEGVVLAH